MAEDRIGDLSHRVGHCLFWSYGVDGTIWKWNAHTRSIYVAQKKQLF